MTDQPLHDGGEKFEGDGAMTIRHNSDEAHVTIAIETLTSESLCIVAFQQDRAAAGYFRRWVSTAEVMEQFRRWVNAEHVHEGHSRSCASSAGCTCSPQRCYTSLIGAHVHGPGCTHQDPP